ncbi:MAG: type II secretion system protein [Lachnospiraceae bacterium]|nr:type II secretion system protein [Lachnospiraceae bacterium]
MEKRTNPHGARNGGFTLVELIVVMAIMAVLAGITVPSYLGYIKKAKEQQNLVEARQLRIAVAAMMMEQSGSGEDVTENDLYASIFWRTLGDEENPLHGFYPKEWDPEGTVTELSIDDDFKLTAIAYEAPDGSREAWYLEDEGGSLHVEVVKGE